MMGASEYSASATEEGPVATHPDHVASVADGWVGRHVDELPTPVLVLDVDALDHNIATMRVALEGHAGLRPHAKTHKCAQIAARQLSAGALGITVATAREARAMAAHGVPEILIANEVCTPEDVADVLESATTARIIIAVDDAANVSQLSRAASEAGVLLGAVIDVDLGMGRCGVRTIDEARALAAAVADGAGLELRGVTGFEGHVVLTPEREARERAALEAVGRLAAAAEALADDGATVEIVSAGGTNTFAATAGHAAVTEIQAGTYAVMDTSYIPFAPGFGPALTVLGTVVSRHGSRTILDCGTKTAGNTGVAPPSAGPGTTVVAVDEEHMLIDLDDAEAQRPRIGDRVSVVVSYCGAAINAHDAYCVVSDGQVVDVWPILARGPGRTPRAGQAR
jgi:D-serine deaminase-like pyridoxal phosphate-dependent protein